MGPASTAPFAVVIEIVCSDVKRRGKNLAGLHLDVVIHRDGQPVATGAASFTCTTPAVYQRIRSGVPAESQAELDRVVAELHARREQLVSLAEVERRHGAEAVRAVVARERPLAEAYEAWLVR